MGQSSMILLIATIVTVSILIFGAQHTTNDAGDALAGYHFKVLSREASMTGLNLTVRKLVSDTTSWVVAPALYGFDTTT
jgi:hypothetical protein